MNKKVEDLFSELAQHVENKSLGSRAVREKFISLSNVLDSIFSDHLKQLAPLLKTEFDQAQLGLFATKWEVYLMHQILKLSNDAGIMANQNILASTKGLPPEHSQTEIDALFQEAERLKEIQNSNPLILREVKANLGKAKLLSTKFYRLPKQKIRRAKFWFRFSNVWVLISKTVLFFATIYLAHLFSTFLKESFGLEGLFSEILVASIFLVTIDRLFDGIKELVFWARYKRALKNFRSVYLNLCKAESDFIKYKKLL